MLLDGKLEQGNVKQWRKQRARDMLTASNRTGIILLCPRALHKLSSSLLCKLMMDFFFSKLEGSSHCLLWKLFSTFSRMNMDNTDCDDSACYIQTNVLKIWVFVWKREKHKISVGGEHIGAETLTLVSFFNRILALFKYKGQEGLLLLIIFTRAVVEKHNLEGFSPSGRTCRA